MYFSKKMHLNVKSILKHIMADCFYTKDSNLISPGRELISMKQQQHKVKETFFQKCLLQAKNAEKHYTG